MTFAPRWSGGADNLSRAGAAQLGSQVQGESEAGGGGAGCREEEHDQCPQWWQEGYLPTLLPQGPGEEDCLPTLSYQGRQRST